MTHILAFFKEIFVHLSSLVFYFLQKSRTKVVIYTDASFSETRNDMDFLLFVKETQQHFVCDAPYPSWLMKVWDDPSSNLWFLSDRSNPWKKRKNNINVLELFATIVLQDHQVFFFCDNTSTMSTVVHGHVHSPDMTDLSNMLYLPVVTLKCTPFFEWVPSLANCTDIPSHPQGPVEDDFYEQVKTKYYSGKMKFQSFEKIPNLNSIFEQVFLFDICKHMLKKNRKRVTSVPVGLVSVFVIY